MPTGRRRGRTLCTWRMESVPKLAEPPFAGADFAPDDEAAMLLGEGNVLMIEPYIWRPGVGGYRAEYCVVVGADSCEVVSTLPYGQWPNS